MNLAPLILDPTAPIGHLPPAKRRMVCEARTAYALDQAARWTGPNAPELGDPGHVYTLMKDRCAVSDVERLYVIPTTASLKPCCEPIIVSVGNESGTEVCYRSILRQVLKSPLAAGAFLAHNHPSNDPAPSANDEAVTRQAAQAFKACGLTLHDHVVITATGGYTSLRRDKPRLFP